MMKLAIEHRSECTGPELVEFWGRQGDRVEQCMACHRMRVLNGPDKIADAREQSAAKPPAAPVVAARQVSRDGTPEPTERRMRNFRIPSAPVLSGYVCREHLAPVNWRGKGCARCAAELAERSNTRRGGGGRDRDED